MSEPTKKKLTREDVAKIEVGQTDISRAQTWTLIGLFLLTLFVVPTGQFIYDTWRYSTGKRTTPVPVPGEIALIADRAAETAQEPAPSTFRRVFRTNNTMLAGIDGYETTLEDESWLTHALLPPEQLGLTYIGVGNDMAAVGRDGWLFYEPGVWYLVGPGFLAKEYQQARVHGTSEYETAPQPDPVQAILQFRDQLTSRDIELVVMPTPVKGTIHGEKLSQRYANHDRPLQNVSYDAFVRQLRDAGVLVYDPAQVVLAGKNGSGSAQYLATDTHWRPEAMETVAADLSTFLREHTGLAQGRREPFSRRAQKVTNLGDIAVMLQMPDWQTHYPPETAEILPVYVGDQSWRADPEAQLLVLGDSFSNIYSFEAMGWGHGAGLVEQLSYHLGLGVDRIVRNDAGAFATREILSRELAAGRDRLAGKKVVVWQFAARELSVGDWKLLAMDVGEAPPSSFLTLKPGQSLEATATVQALTSVPRPGSVTYKNHLFQVHLTDVTSDDGSVESAQAVVYMKSMTDGQWTPAARLRSGDEIRVRLQAYSQVARQYDAVNRSEFQNDLAFEPVCWAEPLADGSQGGREVWPGWYAVIALAGLAGILAVAGGIVLGTRNAARTPTQSTTEFDTTDDGDER